MTSQTINLAEMNLNELRALEAAYLKQHQGQPKTQDFARNLYKIHETLAKRQFPDLDYQQYLRDRHQQKSIDTYLEVGVRWGDALALANEGCYAVGVDPAHDIKKPLKAKPHLFKMTSDDFFFEHTESFRGFFKMIFLDGLHEAHQTTKDIFHAFRVLKEGGEIFSHDVLPVSLEVTAPTQQTRFWTGNVWQAAAAYCVKGAPYKWEFVPAFPSGLFRLYDIDPAFKPSAKDTMARLRQTADMKFNSAPQLLDYLQSL